MVHRNPGMDRLLKMVIHPHSNMFLLGYDGPCLEMLMTGTIRRGYLPLSLPPKPNMPEAVNCSGVQHGTNAAHLVEDISKAVRVHLLCKTPIESSSGIPAWQVNLSCILWPCFIPRMLMVCSTRHVLSSEPKNTQLHAALEEGVGCLQTLV